MLKESTHISRKLVQNILRAFDYARARDIPLNLYVVINLIETDAHAAATLFEMVRHKYRDWLNYRTRNIDGHIPPMYVFTFEGNPSPHVNWVLRVPPYLMEEFERKLFKWVSKVQTVRPHDVHIQRVESGGPYKSLANYICKGCHPAFIEHFHLTELNATHGEQGTFWGKRAGVSPSLNKSVRDAYGYNPKRRTFANTLANAPKTA
jgi:hypothetical protein